MQTEPKRNTIPERSEAHGGITGQSSISHLTQADLRGAHFEGVDLSAIDLSDADLSDADLSDAYMEGADLSSANLASAELAFANLSSANLSTTNLLYTSLIEANLRGAVGLDEKQLAQAHPLEGATMPNGQKYEDWLKGKGRGEGGENGGPSYYTSSSSIEDVTIREMLTDIGRYQFIGDENVYSITVSDPTS